MSEDPGTPSLYDWAGGHAAFERLINAFYDRVERDDLLNPFFPGGVSAEHRRNVTLWWCEVFGGPADYTELPEAPGPTVGATARRLRADARAPSRSGDHRRAAVPLRVPDELAADDAQLPADPEFRAALVGYLEWGTRLAVHNSQPSGEVVEHAPVPHWGWGVAPPYRP